MKTLVIKGTAAPEVPTTSINPGRIMETGMAFWASKVLITAIKLELFTFLGPYGKTGEEIQKELNLHPRSVYDFLDALVALGFLQREGLLQEAYYFCTEETALFLNKNTPAYVGGILEMANDRLYPFWGSLEEALKTGKPQNEEKITGKPIFEALYENPERLEHFMNGMAGAQLPNFREFASKFDFSEFASLCDIGGADGLLSRCVVERNPHIKCISADLPVVETIAQNNIEKAGYTNQISTAAIDFMLQDFPKADIITMGNILHDWDLETKKMLIRKAYDALPEGGAFAVVENIIDNERKQNAFGLMMSLNMLIETESGFDYTFADFESWCREAGFRSAILIPLAGPASAAVAYK